MHRAHKLFGYILTALAIVLVAGRFAAAQTLTIEVDPQTEEVYLPIGTGGQYSFTSKVTAGQPQNCTAAECTNVTTYTWTASSPGQVPTNTNSSGITVTVPANTPAGDYTINVGISMTEVVGTCGTCTGTYTGTGSATLTVHVISVTAIAVVSGASQSGVNQNVTEGATTYLNNFACLQNSSGAIFSATVTPSGEPPAKVASLITWSSGSPVSGQPLQYQFSTSTSTETHITATCGTSSAQADLWVMWCNVSLQFSGNPPANATQPATDYITYLPNTMGVHPDLTVSPILNYGYYTAIGGLTPPGVGNVVSSGWTLNREKIIYDKYGTGVYAGADPAVWSGDTSTVALAMKFTPKLNSDAIYDFDAPSQAADSSSILSPDEECYDFAEWAEWNGNVASDQSNSADHFHFDSIWTWGSGFNAGDLSGGWMSLYGGPVVAPSPYSG